MAKTEANITFDANHEMAGKELNFDIELVEVVQFIIWINVQIIIWINVQTIMLILVKIIVQVRRMIYGY